MIKEVRDWLRANLSKSVRDEEVWIIYNEPEDDCETILKEAVADHTDVLALTFGSIITFMKARGANYSKKQTLSDGFAQDISYRKGR